MENKKKNSFSTNFIKYNFLDHFEQSSKSCYRTVSWHAIEQWLIFYSLHRNSSLVDYYSCF